MNGVELLFTILTVVFLFFSINAHRNYKSLMIFHYGDINTLSDSRLKRVEEIILAHIEFQRSLGVKWSVPNTGFWVVVTLYSLTALFGFLASN